MHRREDGGARADRDPGLSRCDSLPLVAPFRVAQRRVENGDPVAEARAEAADRLRRERDLRYEHDRAATALESDLARTQVDLGLAAPGRAVEQERTAAVEGADDADERSLLRSAEHRRTRLTAERLARHGGRTLGSAAALHRRDELERARRR